MIVLKSKKSRSDEVITRFVNENNIKKEDIVMITDNSPGGYTIFYYADSEKEEITHGIFG